jgi:hypothetical protein
MGIAARWGRSPAAPRTRTRRSSWSWMDNRARRSATKRSQETLPCFLLPTMIFLEQRRKRRKMGNSGEIRRRLFWLVLRRGGRRRIFRVNTDVVGIRAGRFQPRGVRNTRRSLSATRWEEYAPVALLGQHRTAPRFSPEADGWW